MMIKTLRLLPPLAFARFGSAPKPQHNYELAENKDNPLDFRKILPAETLQVDEHGKLTILPTADHPAAKLRNGVAAIFRHGECIRPVAPFFELLAIVDPDPDKLVPVTLQWLSKHGLCVEWKVHVENRKVFRRTGEKDDIVKAKIEWFGGHEPRSLCGTCANFMEGKWIDFGQVQYVEPNGAFENSSHVRLRFTPAKGRIYGPVPPTPRDTALGVIPIYVGDAWRDFDEKMPGTEKKKNNKEDGQAEGSKTWPRATLPPSLYANTNDPPAAPWLNQDRAKSRGYLDDACDGFIYVRITDKDRKPLSGPDGKPLKGRARICVAPPAFIPDSQFVRTLADDLDQVVCGPGADDIEPTEARRRALDIVRRAYETVRFMNVAVMNGNPVDGRPAEAFDTMPAEEAFAAERQVRPVMAPANVDTAAVLGLHQQVFAALSSGAAPWFVSLLRKPEQVGDLTDKGRRKMPALMSGADSYYLALTRRQIATLEKAAEGGSFAPPTSTPSLPPLSPRNLTAQLQYRAKGNPITSHPEMAIANCCPGLEVDFRAVWRRLFVDIELSEWENYVVKGEGTAPGENGPVNLKDLEGHRLLRVDDKPLTVNLTGPSPAPGVEPPIVRSTQNPNGVWTMEWSNCLAHVLDALRVSGKRTVECEFTADAAKYPQPQETASVKVTLRVRDFFEPGTAVISEELAKPGELTEGLCSPWQNDLRECSCFYWASSRPDFVNTKIGNDGLTHGDYWFARERTGKYVPDDYADNRLMTYDDLFKKWEKLLQVQIGGKDSTPELLRSSDKIERKS